MTKKLMSLTRLLAAITIFAAATAFADTQPSLASQGQCVAAESDKACATKGGYTIGEKCDTGACTTCEMDLKYSCFHDDAVVPPLKGYKMSEQ